MITSLVFIILLPFTTADVIRTVYCKNVCNDYLRVPESQMPACAEEHLKMNECGTIITCDWREAEKDKVRPVANSTTDFVCCYRSQIKEKGDCDAQVEVKEKEPPVPEVTVRPTKSAFCADVTLPWTIVAVLVAVLIAETGYLVFLKLNTSSPTKVSVIGPSYETRPCYTARPLLDTRLLA